MMQEIIVYILIGLAVLAVAFRFYKIFTHKHKCCEKGEGDCCCEGCPMVNEGCKEKCKNGKMEKL